MVKEDGRSYSSRAEFESQRQSRQEQPTSQSMPMKNSSIIAAGMVPEIVSIQNPIKSTNFHSVENIPLRAAQDSTPQYLVSTVPQMEEIKLNIDAQDAYQQ